MEVRNCRGCGKLYNYIGSTTPACPQCMKKLDDTYEAVKKYIYDNPGANINQVSTDMDVSIQQLQRWIREERLTFAEGSAVGIECENCGAMIRTGRFCAACKSKLLHDFGGEKKMEPEKPQPKDSGAKMRFL